MKKPRPRTFDGGPRCRLDKIVFVKEVKLPRFTLHIGENWELPRSRYLTDGSAELGGGTIPKDSFIIEVADESRACGCECAKPFVAAPAHCKSLPPLS